MLLFVTKIPHVLFLLTAVSCVIVWLFWLFLTEIVILLSVNGEKGGDP